MAGAAKRKRISHNAPQRQQDKKRKSTTSVTAPSSSSSSSSSATPKMTKKIQKLLQLQEKQRQEELEKPLLEANKFKTYQVTLESAEREVRRLQTVIDNAEATLPFLIQRTDLHKRKEVLNSIKEAKQEQDQWKQRQHLLTEDPVKELYVYNKETVTKPILEYLLSSAKPPEFTDPDVCSNPSCGGVKLILRSDDAQVVCPLCTCSKEYLPATNSSLPFGEDLEVAIHVYYREKHFRLWLNQFRANVTEVPDHVIKIVREEMDKIHLRSTLEVKPTPIKKILKAKGLGEWCDYAVRIAHRLNGQLIPAFTDEEIRILIHMFKLVQTPFLHLKTVRRQNFMNTMYLMRQFCEILNWKQFRKCFPFPKSPKVLWEQDAIFKRICSYIGWSFSRSI